MGEGFPLFPEAATAYAGEVDHLYLALLGFSFLFSIGIFVAILYFAVKYRRRTKDDLAEPPREHLGLEVAWTVIPFALSLGLLVWGVDLFWRARSVPDRPMEIAVVAKQWMWKFRHESGVREIDQLHVPAGRAVHLTLATEDVIHSLFVPAIRLKQDVVPGRYTTLTFEPARVGEYHLFCAEYCGTSHSKMRGKLVVMTPRDYARWLASRTPAESPLAAGKRHFDRLGCITCHDGTATARGPRLAGLLNQRVRLSDGSTTLADPSYLRESVMEPEKKVVAGYRPLMPPFRGRVDEEEVFDLVSYVSSLAGKDGSQKP